MDLAVPPAKLRDGLVSTIRKDDWLADVGLDPVDAGQVELRPDVIEQDAGDPSGATMP